MKPRRLTGKGADCIRQKPAMLDYHAAIRWLQKLNFKHVEDVIQNGEIFQEGKSKFRAVLPIKGNKIAYVILTNFQDYMRIETVGITTKGKKRWG